LCITMQYSNRRHFFIHHLHLLVMMETFTA
jgi:hypothetical protein